MEGSTHEDIILWLIEESDIVLVPDCLEVIHDDSAHAKLFDCSCSLLSSLCRVMHRYGSICTESSWVLCTFCREILFYVVDQGEQLAGKEAGIHCSLASLALLPFPSLLDLVDRDLSRTE